MNYDLWEEKFSEKVRQITKDEEPAHDFLHFQRVVKMSKELAKAEDADMNVVLPAAWLHDFVIIPKSDPRRSQASRLAAEGAIQFLSSLDYPAKYYDDIFHAIEAHSFSANIPTKTLEAQIVQDADRLDALGATGIVRCFATAVTFKSSFYHPEEFTASSRPLEDQKYTVDHFYTKLFKIAETLHTKAAKEIAARRVEYMKGFLRELETEVTS